MSLTAQVITAENLTAPVSAGLTGAELDAAVIAADHARIFHSWSAQAHLPMFSVAGGQGVTLWNHAGESWLDFSSQLVNVNIGYQHPKVVAAIQEQAGVLTTIAPSTANLTRAEFEPNRIRQLMIGRDLSGHYYREDAVDAVSDETVLEARGLWTDELRDVTLRLRRRSEACSGPLTTADNSNQLRFPEL